MDCPVCKEAMIVLELEDIEIDHCLSCKGTWLDAGELELLLEDSGGKDNLLSSFETSHRTTETSRKCPICMKAMEKTLCGPDKKILIDKCLNNHGIWFDAGELNDIIKSGQTVDKDNKILELLEKMFGKK